MTAKTVTRAALPSPLPSTGAMSSLVSTGTVRAAGAAGVSSTRPAAGTGLGAWLAPYLSRTTPLPPGPVDGGLRGRQ